MSFSKALTAGLLAATIASQASALTFGIFGNATNPAANSALSALVTAAHHIAVPVLPGGLAASLGGLDVLWILNANPGGQPTEMLDDFSALSSFVMAGGVVVYHDRNVASAADTLPGGGSIAFTFDVDDFRSNDVTVLNSTNLVTNGPNGIIESDPTGIGVGNSLDHGTFSTNGFALADANMPLGVRILSRANSAEIVDFTFELGLGSVYYSTIPLDYYLDGGAGNPNFVGVYAPNVVAYAASLVPVPEPAAVLLFGVGLLGLAAARRRR